MAATKKLAQFRLTPDANGENAQMHIEDDSGSTIEMTATREQLDLLADALDEMLSTTEAADEV